MNITLVGIIQKQKSLFLPCFFLFFSFNGKSFSKDEFDIDMLKSGLANGESVDITQFEKNNGVIPGDYTVDIYVNGLFVDTRTLKFKLTQDNLLAPVFTLSFLKEIGVNTSVLPVLKNKKDNDTILNIADYIPDSKMHLNLNELKLEVSIPQAYLSSNLDRDVSKPELWDNGIPALLLNYRVSGMQEVDNSNGVGNKYNSVFGGFDGGFNAGAWRVRSQASYSNSMTSSDYSPQRWSVWGIYLQRDIQALKGNFTLGETTTSPEFFDSFQMRGLKLSTNNQMYSNNEIGFSPIITGIAKSNAQVTITQNNNVIYQTYVPPGAFKIEDINQAGTAGDLVVTIKESDGTIHTQNVAYTSLPVMQHPGHVEYSFASGKYFQKGINESNDSPFISGEIAYGLPSYITAYGGSIISVDYLSTLIGAGISLGRFGALSTDMTWAKSNFKEVNGKENKDYSGLSYRMRYSKSMLESGTTLNLASYRYSTKDFYTFNEFNEISNDVLNGIDGMYYGHRKSNTQLTISQSIGYLGNIYLSGQRNVYWHKYPSSNQVTIGYSNNIKGVSFGIDYSMDSLVNYSSASDFNNNWNLSFNISIPISLLLNSSSTSYISNRLSTASNSHNSYTSNIGGTAFDSDFNYNIGQEWSNDSKVSQSSIYANYQSPVAQFMGGYTKNSNQEMINIGVNGGVLAHPYGITLSQTMYDSVALVKAPGLYKSKLVNAFNITVDRFGYAVIPFLSNYRKNTIMLDPSTFPDNAFIENSSKQVYPTKGAVVLADYNVILGQQMLIVLKHKGRYVPFGAISSFKDSSGHNITGIVDDGGRVFMPGMPEHGLITVRWGDTINEQCHASFNITGLQKTDNNTTPSIHSLPVNCI